MDYGCSPPSGGAGLQDLAQEVARLHRELAPALYRYAAILVRNRESARDALQDLFLRYFVARSEGRQIDNARAWLFCVLRNCLLDRLKCSSGSEVALEEIPAPPDGHDDPEAVYRGYELSRRLTAVLAPRELECVRLRSEGLRYGEIAQVLAIRPGTVGALLARAQKKIRQALEQPA